MKHYFIILILIGLSSCMMGTKPMFDKCRERAHTQKEQFFIDSLKNIYCDDISLIRVDYQYRPNFIMNCENNGKSYDLKLWSINDDLINDTIKRKELGKDLIVKIYNWVIEDSIKFYTNCFTVTFANFNSEPKKRFNLEIMINKSDIERYLGEKLVKVNNNFEIEKISKINDIKITEVIDK